MINIPEEIKTILHLDHWYKNIRIHFPNGERSDICNDLIVKDSVSFTESLCSQNTLKFGLAESPVFECEVVGVGNIKGATIEVFCEIECDSAVEDSVFRNDLQKYVYPIPYGVFVVQECKRQADMQHRKIVAYNNIASKKWELAQAEKSKQIYESAYTPNLGYFLTANGINVIEAYSTEEIPAHPFLETWSVSFTAAADDVGNKIRIEVVDHRLMFGRTIFDLDYDALYRVELEYFPITEEEVQNQVASFFLEDERTAAIYRRRTNKERIDWNVHHAFEKYVNQVLGDGMPTVAPINGDEYLYPYLNNFYTAPVEQPKYGYYWPYYIILERTFHENGQDIVERKRIYISDESTRKVYKRKITTINEITNYRLSIPTNYPQDNNIDFSQFSDIQSLANSYIELLGLFGYYDRTGNVRTVNIKRQFGLNPELNLYPGNSVYPQRVTGGELYPEDYQSCWYDDYYMKPFGSISCQYKNTDNKDCLFVLYLPGYDDQTNKDTYQVYSLDNNEIIKGALWTEAQIQNICQIIANNIEGVTYMPVDFVGRGLPYVEAGDTFEILTKSNESITTIVLNRTLTGEQTLTDSYKSV